MHMKKKEGKMQKNKELNRTVSKINERIEELESKIKGTLYIYIYVEN